MQFLLPFRTLMFVKKIVLCLAFIVTLRASAYIVRPSKCNWEIPATRRRTQTISATI